MKSRYDAILNYGGGVGSTALLVLLSRRKVPNINKARTLVLFADTGVERPWTYSYLRITRKFCRERNISFEIVRAEYTLEQRVHSSGVLPSRRIRWCTERLKVRPIRRRAMSDDVTKPYTQLIGFDSSELGRIHESPLYSDVIERFPLIEAGWDRDRCLTEIAKSGLPVPKKSSCFCCPTQRLSTFVLLMQKHPDLLQRALSMERAANKRRKGKTRFYLFKESIEDLMQRADQIVERARKRGTLLDDFGFPQCRNSE